MTIHQILPKITCELRHNGRSITLKEIDCLYTHERWHDPCIIFRQHIERQRLKHMQKHVTPEISHLTLRQYGGRAVVG